MRFPLSYDGPLPSTGNSSSRRRIAKLPHIWAIRNQVHDQIDRVYNTHPALNAVNTSQSRAAIVLLNNPLLVDGHKFFPIARTELHLRCELDVELHVNHDLASIVSNAGDLDNRIKTLLDALRMPATAQEVQGYMPPTITEYCCLLEDDILISALRIETFRNTAPPPGAGLDHVRINMKVRLEPLYDAFINEPFRHD